MKEKGKKDEEIQRMSWRVRRNKMMRPDMSRDNQCIIWGADNAEWCSFETREKGADESAPPKKHTVQSYFKEAYNITLQYPKMPLVFVGEREWFPMEFLFQSFGKMKAANSPEQVNAVLDYYNTNSGTKYVENISNLAMKCHQRIKQLGFTLEEMLAQYNVRKSTDPVELEAKILPEPKLRFADENNSNIRINDGDWMVMQRGRGRKFPK